MGLRCHDVRVAHRPAAVFADCGREAGGSADGDEAHRGPELERLVPGLPQRRGGGHHVMVHGATLGEAFG